MTSVAIPLEWAAIGVVISVVSLTTSLIYNRIMAYKALTKKITDFNTQVFELRTQFAQYQIDIRHYLEICEICRTEVRQHHDGRTAEHVTQSLKDQIKQIIEDVADIKRFLMEHKYSV